MLVGMGLYSTDTPGTGGSIKEKREDFAVNEVLAEKTLSRIAENTGYAVYKLDKNGIDTKIKISTVSFSLTVNASLPYSSIIPSWGTLWEIFHDGIFNSHTK